MTSQDSPLNFFDYLSVVLKHKLLIAGIVFIAAVIAFWVGITKEPFYEVETRIWSNYPNISRELLESNNVLNDAVRTLNVRGPFVFGSLRVASFNNENVVTLEVKYVDPAVAANLANSLVAETIAKQEEIIADMLKRDLASVEEKWKFVSELTSGSNFYKQIDISPDSLKEISEPLQIYVLDEAVPPSEQSRLFTVLKSLVFGVLLGFFFGVIAAFFKEYFFVKRGDQSLPH